MKTEHVATTTSGSVRGREREDVLLFAGIPYAAPPVGALRYARPEPHPVWDGTRAARRFGNAAPQVAGDTLTSAVPKRMAEDCLTLNVTTPALDGARRPVLVWIHGGGFRTGQGGIPWYDGTSFARNGDIVTVSINYRLGALGFANFAELGSDVAESGLSGVLDQIAALGWVRDNIAAFGGDPDRVTIAGESAGAMSVGILLGCPAARGLFHRAIAQSGAAHHTLSADVTGEIGRRLRLILGDDLEALRTAPVERVLDAQSAVEKELAGQASDGRDLSNAGGMPFQPSVLGEGTSLPRSPIQAVRDGASSEVPILVGTNAHETTLFGYGDVDEGRRRRIASRYFDDPDAAVAVYQGEQPDGTPLDHVIALTTDHMFRLPAVRLLEAHAACGGRGYQYQFSWRSRAMGGRLGATHALEIPFAFNNLERAGVDFFLGPGPVPQDLADAMHAAWIAFIRSGDPSVEGRPDWPRFDADRRAVMEFGDSVAVLDDPGAATRELWGSRR